VGGVAISRIADLFDGLSKKWRNAGRARTPFRATMTLVSVAAKDPPRYRRVTPFANDQ